MARIGITLQRAAKQVQKIIAPGIGDDIIEVWRGRTADSPTPGGERRNEMGRTVRSEGPTPTGTQGMVKVAAYYGRYSHTRGGTEANNGAISNIGPTVFIFNAGDSPDIDGDDQLLVAPKRFLRQPLAQLGWVAEFPYQIEAIEQPSVSNRFTYKRISGTVSGMVEPVWPRVKGTTVADGDGEWVCEGENPPYEVIDPGGKGSIQVNYVVTAEQK